MILLLFHPGHPTEPTILSFVDDETDFYDHSFVVIPENNDSSYASFHEPSRAFPCCR
jgi:hypothetical protein